MIEPMKDSPPRPLTAAPRPRLRRAGAATLELALTLTILVNLTFGMVEFGYYFFVKNSCDGAAREGCRAAIVAGATNSQVNTAAQAVLTSAGLNKNNFTILIEDTASTPNAIADVSAVASGSPIQVVVQGTWSTVGAGFRPLSLIGGAKVINGASVMRHE